jgi:hypothetical protein
VEYVVNQASGAVADVTRQRLHTSSLHYLWLVAGTDREDFEQATASPEQLLIGIEPHDTYQVHWTTTGQDYQLAVLMSIGQKMEAVSSDGQELGIVLHKKSHHFLQTTCQSHVHLRGLIVEQHVVESSDGIEQHSIHLGSVHSVEWANETCTLEVFSTN